MGPVSDKLGEINEVEKDLDEIFDQNSTVYDAMNIYTFKSTIDKMKENIEALDSIKDKWNFNNLK